MITDSDIKKLKQEFKKDFATKDDLKALDHKIDTKFATKEDLKVYATKNDLDNAIEKQTEKIESMLIDFRSDIFNKIDRTVGGLAKVEEAQEVISHQVANHEDRITTVESRLHLSN